MSQFLSYLNTKNIQVTHELGNSFGHIKMNRNVHVCIRFQVGNSFGNINIIKKLHLCICFQLGN